MTVTQAYDAAIARGALTADPAQRAILPLLDRVGDGLARPVPRGFFRKAPEPVRGLYLWGGVGRGKSMLMDLLYDTVGVPKRRVHFHAFMQQIHADIARARASDATDPVNTVADALAADLRFLAFDEMQISDITDAMLVGRLFERLFARGVTVVTTSNRPPDDLYLHGLNRDLFLPFIAMLKTRLDVVALDGPQDHRQGRITGAPRYFSPVGPETRSQLDAVWQELTLGQAHPLTLRVTGRDVEIPAFHNGVARARFFDLCGRALGPADYLALAQAARVLVLDDVPRLSRQNYNEAKRFVTLIDALYEARVVLFCSAAERPEMLYVEGEGSFEFARTASRLQEMQAQDWGRASEG